MQGTWNFDGIPADEPDTSAPVPESSTFNAKPAENDFTTFQDKDTQQNNHAHGESSYQQPTAETESEAEPEHRPEPRPRPRTESRQCWMCHDEEFPTYEEPSVLDGVRRRRLRKKWIPKDPSTGPLLSPCLCKGSIGYIHESCLKEYMQNHGAFKCPTCGYTYQMQRLTWAARIQSPLLTLLLTLGIFVVTTFLLGYVGDYILELYLDPLGTIRDSVTTGGLNIDEEMDFDLGSDSWALHFVKGLLSLGLLGFVKAFLAMTPWQWWNLRTSATVYGRAGATGRRRVENINLAFVVIGVFTFLWAVWKGTRAWINKRQLEASFNILNVRKEDDDDDDDDQTGADAMPADSESRKDQ
ncbi:uncharacterized protein B0I36DRAFT_357452 [Microdochium trichocladiopsis]|uniref:RING-CH-type domain-containing protein n=1 Tax=Microdochium trichocladiopsis TaxID=1682393 RepID=A0A9P9BTL3_9PEZI|nr:uncharacterized protein B0I36DRAFT_357452 [Microdochium trichocladiopsis]KAH7040106.1 hypothetical protein B0I36DRAFT_357452 [Microdochium trichocladiopsis]